jgi:hypothetical protein
MSGFQDRQEGGLVKRISLDVEWLRPGKKRHFLLETPEMMK